MGTTTNIGWTDHTFNPWWGCKRVSPACRFCYAEAFAKRTGHGVWGADAPRRFFGDKHWAEPLKWNRDAEAEGRPHLVFCASMADVFEDRRDLDEPRARLFDLIERTPWLRWQLLTKRPENVAALMPEHWATNWPTHAWLGTTVEDQHRAHERIPTLLATPAPVLFLSCEPLLGRLCLDDWLPLDPCECGAALSPLYSWRESGEWREIHCASCGRHYVEGDEDGIKWWPAETWTDPDEPRHTVGDVRTIDWVIVGGESGAGHRPLELDHAREVCRQVLDAAVPLFFKQVGGYKPTAGGDLIDPHNDGQARQWHQFPADVGR